jgi:hypothetical protein
VIASRSVPPFAIRFSLGSIRFFVRLGVVAFIAASLDRVTIELAAHRIQMATMR